MAIERDFHAERTARIDVLMADAKRILAAPPDRIGRQDICIRLDAAMKELGCADAFRRSHLSQPPQCVFGVPGI
jgi:hypothetical protein